MKKLLLATVVLVGLTIGARAGIMNGADINGPQLANHADAAGLRLDGVILPDTAQ